MTENAWLYKQTEPGLWTVGHYWNDGTRDRWEPESDHHNASNAADRVRYLNGGVIPRTDDDQLAVTVVVEEPPGPASQFIEVENDQGNSVRVGEWTTAANGWGRLRITVADIRKALR